MVKYIIYTQKMTKKAKITSLWRHIDVKIDFLEKNFTFIRFLAKFLTRCMVSILSILPKLSWILKKHDFLAFFLYFFNKLPIKRWFSKNIVDYPPRHAAKIPNFCTLLLWCMLHKSSLVKNLLPPQNFCAFK